MFPFICLDQRDEDVESLPLSPGLRGERLVTVVEEIEEGEGLSRHDLARFRG
jgi:hypothetical protein